MQVLLIEDDPALRSTLTDLLAAEEMEVDGLSNAEDALILLGAGQVPDVLIADVDLGNGLSGFDLSDVARTRHPDVEVIIISGQPPAEGGRQPRAHETFLQKPFSPDAFLAAIRAAVPVRDPDSGR